MSTRILRAVTFLILVYLVPFSAACAQDTVRGQVRFEQATFEQALDHARTAYEGRLFLYYYRDQSSMTPAIEEVLLGDETLSAFINDHFARYAVDILSEESAVIQQTYGLMGGDANPDLHPTLAFIDERGVELFYWNESPTAEDVTPLLDLARALKERSSLGEAGDTSSYSTYSEALQLAQQNGKNVLIYFYAAVQGHPDRLEDLLPDDPAIETALHDQFVWVRAEVGSEAGRALAGANHVALDESARDMRFATPALVFRKSNDELIGVTSFGPGPLEKVTASRWQILIDRLAVHTGVDREDR